MQCVHMRLYMHAYNYMHLNTDIHIYIYIYRQICIYTYICVCMLIFICTHLFPRHPRRTPNQRRDGLGFLDAAVPTMFFANCMLASVAVHGLYFRQVHGTVRLGAADIWFFQHILLHIGLHLLVAFANLMRFKCNYTRLNPHVRIFNILFHNHIQLKLGQRPQSLARAKRA